MTEALVTVSIGWVELGVELRGREEGGGAGAGANGVDGVFGVRGVRGVFGVLAVSWLILEMLDS